MFLRRLRSPDGAKRNPGALVRRLDWSRISLRSIRATSSVVPAFAGTTGKDRCLTTESKMRGLGRKCHCKRNANPSHWPAGPLAVDLIGAFLERCSKAREGGVEHRPHQHREHPALELVDDEEADIASLLSLRFESPAVL